MIVWDIETGPLPDKKLKEIFTVHGILDQIHPDNGSQSVSREFRSFASLLGFVHSPSSPNFTKLIDRLSMQSKLPRRF